MMLKKKHCKQTHQPIMMVIRLPQQHQTTMLIIFVPHHQVLSDETRMRKTTILKATYSKASEISWASTVAAALSLLRCKSM